MEENKTQHQAIAAVRYYPYQLNAQKVDFSCVYQALVHVEYSNCQYAPDSTKSVD